MLEIKFVKNEGKVLEDAVKTKSDYFVTNCLTPNSLLTATYGGGLSDWNYISEKPVCEYFDSGEIKKVLKEPDWTEKLIEGALYRVTSNSGAEFVSEYNTNSEEGWFLFPAGGTRIIVDTLDVKECWLISEERIK